MTTLAPAPVRRRKRLMCQQPGCEAKAVVMCSRCKLLCAEHRHGECCMTEVGK